MIRSTLRALTGASIALACSSGMLGASPACPGAVDAVRAALERLRPALEQPTLDRARWERLASSAARGLAQADRLELTAALRDELSTPLERVTAAELLRRLSPRDTTLGEADLARLRVTAFGGLHDSASASAARRALMDLGDWSDRVRMVQELESAISTAERDAAIWCLRSVRRTEPLTDLARLLAEPRDPETRSLAAAAAEAILSNAERAGFPPTSEQRARLAEAAFAALDTPFCPPQLEQRACALLGQLADAPARGRLELLAREGNPAAARALARSEPGLEQLAAIVSDPFLVDARRVEAAAALAGAPAGDDRQRGLALDALCRVATGGLDRGQRRMAVCALTALEDGRARQTLALLRAEADDPTLRSMAAAALERRAE